MRYILLFLFSISTSLIAQQKDCFDIARKGTVEQMMQLYEANHDVVNSKNDFGFTPLILACYQGNNEVATFLIKKNADINYVSDEGTALMAAVVKGNLELVKVLLMNKANPDLTNSLGTTALMYAVQFNNSDITKLLLEFNANKKQINIEGKTAFEYAVFSKNELIINLLK
jgi:ankyrin repeat protein